MNFCFWQMVLQDAVLQNDFRPQAKNASLHIKLLRRKLIQATRFRRHTRSRQLATLTAHIRLINRQVKEAHKRLETLTARIPTRETDPGQQKQRDVEITHPCRQWEGSSSQVSLRNGVGSSRATSVDARPLTRITRIKGSRDRIHRKIRRIKDEEAILIRAWTAPVVLRS
jgi:hypothetical protein